MCDFSSFVNINPVIVTVQAIEFAMEEEDDELWDVLIRLSITNPSKLQASYKLFTYKLVFRRN